MPRYSREAGRKEFDMKHFIDLHEDVGIEELNYLLDIAADMKAKVKTGVEHHYLKGKSLAMIFTKSSTRTRVCSKLRRAVHSSANNSSGQSAWAFAVLY